MTILMMYLSREIESAAVWMIPFIAGIIADVSIYELIMRAVK